ncbi:MFS transporter [Amycolatopsis rubida]|nr:MFS transporter [Amycolatopsis rubida]
MALFAGASALGGLLYGRLNPRMAVERQLLVLGTALIGVSATAGLIGSTPALVVGNGIAGGFIAPLLIVGYLAADARTDPTVRTEASSWINTAINLGAAAGSGLLGATTETTAPGTALAICAAAAAFVLLVSAPRRRRAVR